MCAHVLAALLGLSAGCAEGAPAHLPAPADPHLGARFRPPPSPLAGLKHYQPVEARSDWGSAPLLPSGAGKISGTMPGMKGMSVPGMSMPGMDMGGKR